MATTSALSSLANGLYQQKYYRITNNYQLQFANTQSLRDVAQKISYRDFDEGESVIWEWYKQRVEVAAARRAKTFEDYL